MNITATHIYYLTFCKRKLWLSSNFINMEKFNSDVHIDKIIEEKSFKRRSNKNKNVQMDNIKVDYIDVKNKIIYETKKSSKHIYSAIWQMKFYLYSLKSNYKGIIEIPVEKKKIDVNLTPEDILKIIEMEKQIVSIKKSKIPDKLNSNKCNNCSFFNFCYS